MQSTGCLYINCRYLGEYMQLSKEQYVQRIIKAIQERPSNNSLGGCIIDIGVYRWSDGSLHDCPEDESEHSHR